MSKKNKDSFSIRLDGKKLNVCKEDIEIGAAGILLLTLKDYDELSKINITQRHRHTLEIIDDGFSYTSVATSYLGKELRFSNGFYHIIKYRAADVVLKKLEKKEVKSDG